MSQEPLFNLSYQEAKILNDKCAIKKTSTRIIEAKRYGISDVGLRKKVENVLGNEFQKVYNEGVVNRYTCDNCHKVFDRLNYNDRHLDGNLHFCNNTCQIEYNKKHNTVNDLPASEVKKIYDKYKSYRAVGEQLGISKTTCEKRLHNLGILQASDSLIKAQGLKPFQKRF